MIEQLYPCDRCGKLWSCDQDARLCRACIVCHWLAKTGPAAVFPDTIELRLWQPDGITRTDTAFTVRAKRFGDFIAVNEATDTWDYNVTHVPTGRKFLDFEEVEPALALAAALVAEIPVALLDFSDDTKIPEEFKRLSKAIVERHKPRPAEDYGNPEDLDDEAEY